MAFTYTEANLDPFFTDTTDQDAALAWVRKISRDTKNQGVYSDVEWQAELKADAVTYSSTTYYRPHATYARVLLTDPQWHKSDAARGGSAVYRDASEMAQAIRSNFAWIDQLIDTALGTSIDLQDLLNPPKADLQLILAS